MKHWAELSFANDFKHLDMNQKLLRVANIRFMFVFHFENDFKGFTNYLITIQTASWSISKLLFR